MRNTSIARLAPVFVDEDNGDLTTDFDYDDLGRPTKVRSAANTGLEAWTVMVYNDTARRVIAKSDLVTVGDGKKVAIQHYDQLGRVRLSRTLENAATEDPTNEAHGTKVETKYETETGYTYQANIKSLANHQRPDRGLDPFKILGHGYKTGSRNILRLISSRSVGQQFINNGKGNDRHRCKRDDGNRSGGKAKAFDNGRSWETGET